MRRAFAKTASFLVLGSPGWLGFPKPDHRLFETHPIINSQLVYHVGHGDIEIRPQVEKLCGDEVRFTDGSQSPFDVIVYATGYNVTLPFLDDGELQWSDGRPQLFLNVLHPDRDDLFFAGFIQPDSGQFGLVDCQAQLIAEYLQGLQRGTPAADWLQAEKKRRAGELNSPVHYVDSPRHALEVEHFSYRRRLQQLIRKLQHC